MITGNHDIYKVRIDDKGTPGVPIFQTAEIIMQRISGRLHILNNIYEGGIGDEKNRLS
jgi:hypothetical protein